MTTTPSLPAVAPTLESHTVLLRLIREALETRERRTGNLRDSFISVRDLLDLDLLEIVGGDLRFPPPKFFTPVLQNSWVRYNSDYAGPGYYKDVLGRVHFRGLIRDGTAAIGTVLFTLPSGFRPAGRLLFTTVSHDGANMIVSRIDVLQNGEVQILLGGNTWFSLNGVSFVAEQ